MLDVSVMTTLFEFSLGDASLVAMAPCQFHFIYLFFFFAAYFNAPRLPDRWARVVSADAA